MAVSVQFRIEGLEQALANMKALPSELRKQAGRAALRKAALVVLQAAQANAAAIDDPKTAEEIRKNLAAQFAAKYLRETGDLMYRVGVRGGARKYANNRWNRRKQRVGQSYATDGARGNPGGDTWYWRFIEFGTEHSAARPFMRPALSSSVEAATSVAAVEFDKAITRITKRMGGG